MNVIAVYGGLGSQMFKYAFYLALKELNVYDLVIDRSAFFQRKSRGFQLERLFGLNAPDIVDLLPTDTVNKIRHNEICYIDACLNYLVSISDTNYYVLGYKENLKHNHYISPFFRNIKRKILYILHFMRINFEFSIYDVKDGKNAYFDEYFHNSDMHFNFCEEKIKSAFCFMEFNDDINAKISDQMIKEASTCIHVRRGDHLWDNRKLLKNGYFKNSVDYVRKHESGELVFYIFSDDIDWCKKNYSDLGLNYDDKVFYVDWNTGYESYKDMQLMTFCKNNIITISSFGWWGYYLSRRKNKIVCAPKGYWKDIPYHF